jgi:hypothetical protein
MPGGARDRPPRITTLARRPVPETGESEQEREMLVGRQAGLSGGRRSLGIRGLITGLARGCPVWFGPPSEAGLLAEDSNRHGCDRTGLASVSASPV